MAVVRARDINEFVGRLRSEAAARRSGRRRRLLLLASFVSLLFVVAIVGAPALICATSFGDALLRQAVEPYGWQAEAEQIRVGWLTPLEIDNLKLVGPSGETTIEVGQLRTGLFATDLLHPPAALGPMQLVGVDLRSGVDRGITTLEQDLEPVFEAPRSGATPDFQLDLEQGTVVLESLAEGRRWSLDELEGELTLDPQNDHVECSLVGRLGNDRGANGTFAVVVDAGLTGERSDITVESQLIPVDIADLFAVRFPDLGLPVHIDGQLSGLARMHVEDGIWRLSTKETVLNDVVALIERGSATPVSVGGIRLSGSCATDGEALRGEGFTVESELGRVAINGVIDLAKIDGVATKWTELIDGSAEFHVDLARASGFLEQQAWIRKDAQIETGQLSVTATSIPVGEAGVTGGLRFTGSTTAIRVATAGGPVNVQPISLDAELLATQNTWRAKRLELGCFFADVNAAGSLRNGNVNFDVDLEKMSRFLTPILQFDLSQLAGRSRGNIAWSVQPDSSWKLEGDANASHLAWQTADGSTISQPWVKLNINAFGSWNGERLGQLTQAKVGMKDSTQQWTVELVQSVDSPTLDSLYPVRALGAGRLDGLEQTFKPWIPEKLAALTGNYDVDIQGELGRRGGSLRRVKGKLEKASARVNGTAFYQPTLGFYFDGWIDPQQAAFHADLFQVQGTAVSFSAQGSFGTGSGEGLEVAYLADLQQMAVALSGQEAATIRPVSHAPPSAEEDGRRRWLEGKVKGNCWIVEQRGGVRVEGRFDGTKIALFEQGADPRFAGPIRPASLAAPRQLWYEPALTAAFAGEIDRTGEVIDAELIQLDTAWANVKLEGQYVRSDKGWELNVNGPARTDTKLIGQRISGLLNEPLEISGQSEAPLTLRVTSRAESDDPAVVSGAYTLKWDQAALAGLRIGPASMPIRFDSERVQLEQSAFPVNDGSLTLAGSLDFSDPDGPLVRLEPGCVAEGLHVDSNLCRSWLKYIAPTVADATNVDGVLGFEIDQLIWYSKASHRSTAAGRVRINGARVGPGPMIRDVVATVNALRAAAGRSIATSNTQHWLDLPQQTVEFRLADNRIEHDRLLMRVGDVQLVSSGAVSTAGNVDLDLQVPIRAEWVEKQPVLAAYSGQSLVLPVDGTLSRPSLDSSGVRQLLSEAGSRAIENTARNALDPIISRGIQKLFGQ